MQPFQGMASYREFFTTQCQLVLRLTSMLCFACLAHAFMCNGIHVYLMFHVIQWYYSFLSVDSKVCEHAEKKLGKETNPFLFFFAFVHALKRLLLLHVLPQSARIVNSALHVAYWLIEIFNHV